MLDEKGEMVPPESVSDETGKIGLVHPEELAETERSRWKKYAGKEKWKQPFPQLKMPVCQGQHDFSALSGVQVTELFLITAAGKWGLYQGSGIHCTGGFPGNHWKRGKKKGQMTLNR